VLGVDFPDNSTTEPIDSLQVLFDETFPPVSTNDYVEIQTSVYPNPAHAEIVFEIPASEIYKDLKLSIFDSTGKEVYQQLIKESKTIVSNKNLGEGQLFLYQLISKNENAFTSGKIIFQD